jgi:hypothetical protein
MYNLIQYFYLHFKFYRNENMGFSFNDVHEGLYFRII